MDLTKIRKICFIGLGGIGISAIAKMMLAQNKIVSGSDLVASEIIADLEKIGAKIHIGHKIENLDKDTDLVIYSPAVPENNPERQWAAKLNIPQLSYPEFLGQLSKEKFTIAVSGTNGKSTTTALLGLILEAANFDPLVIVGSKVPQWNGNLRLPQINVDQNADRYRYLRESASAVGRDISVNQCNNLRKSAIQVEQGLFVVEGCEWRAHMLNLEPKIIILTNLEEDHLDYYRNINQIIETFQKYIEKLPKEGILILNADDENLLKLRPKCRVITYGIKSQADVMAKNIIVQSGRQEFDLISQLSMINSHLSIKIPGLFNIYNTLAATTCALILGVKIEIIKKILENFSGIWRRFEISSIQYPVSSIVISDYAHHPTAVQGTIQAAREFYPGRRIVVVFQPHHRNRTKKLFNDFVKSFDQADVAIISEIYDVAGREQEQDADISSKDLVMAIKVRMKNKINLKEVFYTKNLVETKDQLLRIIQPNDVVLIMGAGDIYKIINF